ncbi:MAG TPA: protein kinase [Gemmataceae bacterium]|jgi:serine/threonine protein kinase/class 3 adenylate cyclase|nr:protein kinase [Gemmataceae bacterium]
MSFDQFTMLSLRSAGSDGVAHAALAPDSAPVEMRILSGARADPARWFTLCRHICLAALLDHPAALRIIEMDLSREPPYLVVESTTGKSLAERFWKRTPPSGPETISLARQLAEVLATAHHLGLAHGQLCPSKVLFLTESTIALDFSGTLTGTASSKADFADLDRACQAPESAQSEASAPARDQFALGVIFLWLVHGEIYRPGRMPPTNEVASRQSATAITSILETLAVELVRTDPTERPDSAEIATRLRQHELLPEMPAGETGRKAASTHPTLDLPASGAALAATHILDAPPAEAKTALLNDEIVERGNLGRYHIRRKIGQGGMGAVYEAEDPVDGRAVAIKVLRQDWAQRPTALRRFRKEARLLAEVNNPFIANLLEVNEDAGIHFLTLELIRGQTLDHHLEQSGRLDETTSLRIMADVARALVEAHERGIVHRDVKPDNIMLVECAAQATPDYTSKTLSQVASPVPESGAEQRVKLMDFGLARHVIESESLNVTQAGAILGTPLYMAPEQCVASGKIDARTDVYAMGATLFHLLAGRPPFLGESPIAVISAHVNNPPPVLKSLVSSVSDAVSQVIERCLAKNPDERYANAGQLLSDLERIRRGEPTSIGVHPKLPAYDPDKVVQYDWSWQLEASPQQLWPYIANTDRLNKAAGLPSVGYTTEVADDGVHLLGQLRKAGMTVTWREFPFEWVEGRRMGVLREFSQGPFKWLVNIFELTPRPQGGTTLMHKVRVEPTGIVGRTAAALEIGLKGRKAVDRIYRRIDAAVLGRLGDPGLVDPFEPPAPLAKDRRQRLDTLLDRLIQRGVEPDVTQALGEYVAEAPAQEIARIRPLALARRLGLPEDQVVAGCLQGAREGLFVLFWDILCPLCRIASDIKDSLRLVRDHGHCAVCNLDFEIDFANSVELIFRAHPEIRAAEVKRYCAGGPAHSPHVVAQVRLAPGERMALALELSDGLYRLRGPQLPFQIDVRVEPGASAQRWEVKLATKPDADLCPRFKTGRQVLELINDQACEMVVRLERTLSRDNALTAAKASALALFRQLFPDEILSPGQLVSVANVTLLVTAVDQAHRLYEEWGDARAFSMLHEHFRLLEEQIKLAGGALVKTHGEGAIAAFTDPVAAVRAALALQVCLERNPLTNQLILRAGIHRGPARAATLNDQLDYFGSVVHLAVRLPDFAPAGALLLTQTVASDPRFSALLNERGFESETRRLNLPGWPSAMVECLTLPTTKSV